MEFLTQQIDDLFSGNNWDLDAFQRVVVYMDTATLRRVYQIAQKQEAGMVIRLREMATCLKHHGDYRKSLIQQGALPDEEPCNT